MSSFQDFKDDVSRAACGIPGKQERRMIRFVAAIIGLVPLAGILLGFGGWASVGLGGIIHPDDLTGPVEGTLMLIFCGGLCVAAIVAYVGFIIAAPWQTHDARRRRRRE
jgi:hypothetical protein